MGDKDILTKQYVSDNRIFADICNFYIYDGRQVILPEQLHPLDVSELTVLGKVAGKNKSIKKDRDLLMSVSAMQDKDTTYLILGIENQSAIHYAMPVRNMLYDALRYDKQVAGKAAEHREKKDVSTSDAFVSGFRKEDELLPVITVVLYFGTKPWDGPTSLHEMMPSANPEILQYTADYKLQLIAPYHLSEKDLNKFQTNIKQVLSFIKYAKDKEKMAELMQDEALKALDRNAALVIESCTNLKLNLENTAEEEIDMCQAIDEMIEDGRMETRKEMAIELLKENVFSLEKIAALTKLSIAEIEALQQTI